MSKRHGPLYADIYGVPRKGREQKIERLLAFSNLTPFKRRMAGNLSGGMKQKLGLACFLIHTPKVLFLDEPTNGVDMQVRAWFNSNLESRNFYVPGVIAIIVMLITLMLTSMAVVREKRSAPWSRLWSLLSLRRSSSSEKLCSSP